MCLIVLGWQSHAELPLVVAANRDEFHRRPSAQAAFWDDHPEILAGRDLEAGGTWMGVSRSGRFAAVTNYRGAKEASAAESRGALVTRFLRAARSPGDFMNGIDQKAYSGFNLLACDGEELWWMSNRNGPPRRLAPGIYGLGNTLLDAPEVDAIKASFAGALSASPAMEPLFSLLGRARILHPDYGTRCSTVLLKTKDRTQYAERAFSPDGTELETARYLF